MKINFNNYNLEDFTQKEGIFCGIESVLITPKHIGAKFTQKNKIFRSSIWSKDGNLLSAGFPKFVNLGENPENFPVPKNLNNTKIVNKEDGSLLIVDFVNEKLSMRTRGTFSYETMENKEDFEYILDKYPSIKDLARCNDCSFLFELTTPNLKVVLNYPEVDAFLVGIVEKINYKLLSQKELDECARNNGLKRPVYYEFKELDDLCVWVKNAKNIEGACLYSKNDQEIHKIKSDDYLVKHRLKDELCNPERVLDVWFKAGRPSYFEFRNYIITNFDYEIFTQVMPDVSRITDANKKVNEIIDGMKRFVDRVRAQFSNKDFKTNRKNIAAEIFSSYGGSENNRTGMVFSILDRGELEEDQIKKLMLQVLG